MLIDNEFVAVADLSAVLLHDNDNEDTKRLLIGLDRLVKHYGLAFPMATLINV
jgi:hypothetical protein